MYDLVIIGAGPAGITAAVYAARKMMNFIVISLDVGGQAAWTQDIENYIGYQFISGPDLVKKFEEHIEQYNIPLKLQENILDISKDDHLTVKTDKDTYKTRSIIITSGKKSRELGVPGENEFKNKGLTYCATCDGPLFKDKEVAIVGGGNSALEACIQLEKIAKRIYIINIADDLTGDEILKKRIKDNKNISIFNSSKVRSIYGDKFLKGIKIETKDGEKDLDVEGVFVEIGLIPNVDFAKIVDKNDKNEIRIDSLNKTNIEGIFAAGDVTDVAEKQIIIAAGEGAKALLSSFKYLSRINKP